MRMRRFVGWRTKSGRRVLVFAAGSVSTLLSLMPHQRAAAADAGPRKPVWIDTDPACGQGETADVDDCWALLLALSSPELEIRGISTVFGNADQETAWVTARSVLERFAGGGELAPIYRGAERASGGAGSNAVTALAMALEKDRLTILALGPLTNVATVLTEHPQLARSIDWIVAVGGTRPTQRRLFPGTSMLLHFHDLNFVKDPAAFETVLESGVPVSLLPFEAAQKVTVTQADLAVLASGGPSARWLAEESRGWMRFWQNRLGLAGFHPFDSLAVGYVIEPLDFACELMPARVTRVRSFFAVRDAIEVSQSFEDEAWVTYCSEVGPAFKKKLVARLMAHPADACLGAEPGSPVLTAGVECVGLDKLIDAQQRASIYQ